MLSFRKDSVRTNYMKVLAFSVISYGIVLHQYVKSKQLKFEWSNLKLQMLQLDNLQYFTLSLVLLVCSLFGGEPIGQSITSMVIYSLFHALNYFKENVLQFIPISAILKASLSNKISFFTTQFNGSFFQAALISELTTMCRVCLTLPFDSLSLLMRFNIGSLLTMLSIWSYAIFFKLRFKQNEQMRLLCAQLQAKVDHTVATRFPMLMDKWTGMKHLAFVFFDRILP